jgi:hypothetical protein
MLWNGWNGFDVDHMDWCDPYLPLLDHTLRLIQLNWVVLAYNTNIANRC